MKRELRARGGSLKNPSCPHTIVQAFPVFKYARGYLITGAPPQAGTGLKMKTIIFFKVTLLGIYR